MKILIDIGHPAHVHLFRNFAKKIILHGHSVLFTTRDKEVSIDLLRSAGLDYINLGKPFSGIIGKLWGMIKFDLQLISVSRKFKPDIFLSHGSFYAAHASAIMGKINIALEDSGNMEQIRLYKPFTDTILVGSCFHKNLGEKEIRYQGYHELAYLHPNQFTPDINVVRDSGIDITIPYFILRFVSWSASHDAGQNGIDYQTKLKLIEKLSARGRVLISSEGHLPSEFEPYRIQIRPENLHHILAFASLYIGEGATTATECAVLGTPAIYVNSIDMGYVRELEDKYSLLFGFRNSEKVIEKTEEIISMKELKNEFQSRRQIMLKDKIDVTEFMVWFIENYPSSAEAMRKNPQYQYNFR